MLRLRSSVAAAGADRLGSALNGLDGVRRVTAMPEESPRGGVVYVADVEPAAADVLVETIAELGIAVEDYVLERVDVVAPERRQLSGSTAEGFAWIEVMGQARANSRPLARYLALITVAAVIATVGVIKSSGILIVGAMAVSPDLLPICATCVGLVAGRRMLASRSFATLVIGLGSVIFTAAIVTWLLKELDLVPAAFTVHDSLLEGLASTDWSTVLVALAAGVAGILAFETRASAAVGVAISVTTIPASAYAGVALGAGGRSAVPGALLVLAVNVTLMITSGTATLLLQRALPKRSG